MKKYSGDLLEKMQEICGRFSPSEAFVFGSFLRGRAYNDIDIALFGKRSRSRRIGRFHIQFFLSRNELRNNYFKGGSNMFNEIIEKGLYIDLIK